ncbi:hypothetical protein [Photobacterium angustum]|nr:hypothetical protein [Photobacterium angustum]
MTKEGLLDFGQNENQSFRANALLMIKDFNNNDNFVISNDLMSNSDVPSIVCASINGCNEIDDNDPRRNTKNRIRTIDITELGQNIKDKKYNIYRSYNVEGSMFNKENWKQVK